MHDVGMADGNEITPAFVGALQRNGEYDKGEPGRDMTVAEALSMRH